MNNPVSTFPEDSLNRCVLEAGGVIRSANEGETVFRWRGHPRAFILLTSGKLIVHFRTTGHQLPWVAWRVDEGQDCLPVTAAILSEREITVRATCAVACTWIELPPDTLLFLVHGNMAFRRALFASHAQRLPTFFSLVSPGSSISLDRRLADWLLGHAVSGQVVATHGEIATDLLTAREVVSRRLRGFASKGWIMQERGCIRLDAPAALRRLSEGRFYLAGQPCFPKKWRAQGLGTALGR